MPTYCEVDTWVPSHMYLSHWPVPLSQPRLDQVPIATQSIWGHEQEPARVPRRYATPDRLGIANHVTKSNHHCYLTYQLSATQAIYPLSSSRQPRNRAPRSPPQYSRKQTDNLHQFLFLLTTSLLDAIRSSLRTFAAERNRQSPRWLLVLPNIRGDIRPRPLSFSH